MTTIQNDNPFLQNDWLPESDPDSGFALWNDLPYNEHAQRETTAQPLVVQWSQFEARVARQKAIRDSLRKQGFCFFPWVVVGHFKITWHDFSQGNRGSCAGCATNHAVNAMLLTHLADGYKFRYKRFNPYLTWELGKKDAGIRGEGASLSAMLTCANKRGMFDVEKVGTYEQSLRTPPKYTGELLADAEKCQIGACYLGYFRGRELARIVFDCVAAGFPVTFGNSIAVSKQVNYTGHIKTAINRGSWMHATARIAYRRESDGTEYIAHQGSWGKYWEVGKYEGEPASIIWESFDTFSKQCSGRYSDAFAICMVEGELLAMDGFNIAPIKITKPMLCGAQHTLIT
jgi:hypothetical protein